MVRPLYEAYMLLNIKSRMFVTKGICLSPLILLIISKEGVSNCGQDVEFSTSYVMVIKYKVFIDMPVKVLPILINY